MYTQTQGKDEIKLFISKLVESLSRPKELLCSVSEKSKGDILMKCVVVCIYILCTLRGRCSE